MGCSSQPPPPTNLSKSGNIIVGTRRVRERGPVSTIHRISSTPTLSSIQPINFCNSTGIGPVDGIQIPPPDQRRRIAISSLSQFSVSDPGVQLLVLHLHVVKMGDIKSTSRAWDEMEIDVLVNIFKKLNMIELAPVSQVSRNWRLASSDSLLWSVLDLGLLKSNFILTRASPYIYVDDRSDRRLTQVLRTSMALSRANVTCIIFHFNLFLKDDHLSYISERSPHVKRLVLPAWNRLTKNGICQAVRRWGNLESMTMPSIGHPPYIMEEIGRSCKNFSELKVMGTFDWSFAAAIATNIPNLKVLSIRCSKLAKEALTFLLDHMESLEVLNISHCHIIEGPNRHVIQELDPSILQKASRLRDFFFCQDDSCIACQRMHKDDGLMRWYKYEECFWRRDEVSSLNLGDYSKMFEAACVDLIMRGG